MKHNYSQTFSKRPFSALIILLGLSAIMFLVGCNAAQGGTNAEPSSDFQPLAEVNLSTQSYDAKRLGEFTWAETAVVTLAYTLPNINTTLFDLRLVDSAGESWVILHSENYRTDEHGGGSWEHSLPAGEYHLVLTAAQSPGVLSVQWQRELSERKE